MTDNKRVKGILTLDERLYFSELCKKGYRIKTISTFTHLPDFKIRDELKRGLEESNYVLRHYMRYDVTRALGNLIIEKIGKENFLFFIEEIRKDENYKMFINEEDE